MRVRQLIPIGLSLVVAGAGIAFAWSGGPPASRTGVPLIGTIAAEGTCVGCHSDFALNSGATLTLVGAPNFYVAGGTYTFAVQVASTQTAGNPNRVWSFELTAVRMDDGTGVGTFANVAGEGTQIRNGSGQYSTRRYIECTTDRPGATTPVQWQVQWTAPASGAGSVGFFAAGIAGDGDGGKSGDRVCTGSSVMADVTAVESATWGRVKSLYR